MAKAKLSVETKEVLADLENRVMQFIEVNELYKEGNETLVETQNRAFYSVLTLIDQIKETGAIKRQTDWERERVKSGEFSEGIEQLITKNNYQDKLI